MLEKLDKSWFVSLPNQPKPKRVVPFSELEKDKCYSDLGKLGRLYQHDAIEVQGVIRWTPNDVVRFLLDNKQTLLLNEVWMNLDKIHLFDLIKFYMLMGYSLSGFLDVFSRPATDFSCENPLPSEDAIKHVLRVCKEQDIDRIFA